MKKVFQIFLGLFGVTAIFIASLHIIFGPSAIPGSVPVNATMDSEDRFYATLFAAYGVALLWCIRDIERKSMVVYFLAGVFFVGGLARLVSIVAVGLPNTFIQGNDHTGVAHSFLHGVYAIAHCESRRYPTRRSGRRCREGVARLSLGLGCWGQSVGVSA